MNDLWCSLLYGIAYTTINCEFAAMKRNQNLEVYLTFEINFLNAVTCGFLTRQTIKTDILNRVTRFIYENQLKNINNEFDLKTNE